MNPSRCPVEDDEDLVHQYVAGTLPPDAVDPFEIHMLECDACQASVRHAATVRAGLGRPPRGATPWFRKRVAWLIPVAAAAVVVVLLPTDRDPLADLARIDTVPIFEAVPVRADPDRAAATIDDGMAAYVAGDFARAATLLGQAFQQDSSAGPAFFLGLARLKIGAAAEAIPPLNAALRPPENPYVPEAHLYLAKAWLGLGRGDSALAHLRAVPAQATGVHAHAVALADSVRAIRP